MPSHRLQKMKAPVSLTARGLFKAVGLAATHRPGSRNLRLLSQKIKRGCQPRSAIGCGLFCGVTCMGGLARHAIQLTGSPKRMSIETAEHALPLCTRSRHSTEQQVRKRSAAARRGLFEQEAFGAIGYMAPRCRPLHWSEGRYRRIGQARAYR